MKSVDWNEETERLTQGREKNHEINTEKKRANKRKQKIKSNKGKPNKQICTTSEMNFELYVLSLLNGEKNTQIDTCSE